MAWSTADFNCSLVIFISDWEDKLGDSITTEDAGGIGATRAGVSNSGVTDGTEIQDDVTGGVDCTDGIARGEEPR